MGADGKIDGVRVEFFGRSRSSYPTGKLLARVFCDCLPGVNWAVREQFRDSLGKRLNVGRLEFDSLGRRALPRGFARLRVGQALRLRVCECGFLDQNTLPFIALPSTTESHYNRVQR